MSFFFDPYTENEPPIIHDTAENWTAGNRTLQPGQFGVETDTGKFKIGDGVTAWNDRDYHGSAFSDITGSVVDNAALLATLKKLAFPPIYSNQWRNGYPGTNPSTGSGWIGSIWTAPHLVGVDHQISKIRIPVTTGTASGKIRLAIYADVNGVPGALIEQSTELDASSTGEKEYVLSAPVTLTGAMVHLAFQVNSNAIAVRMWIVGPYLLPRIDGAAPHTRYFAAQAYGAFPSTYPSGTAGAANAVPMIETYVV